MSCQSQNLSMKHKNVKQINIFVKSLHLVVSLENFKKVRITLIVYFFQLDFMLDLQITHVINPCEQEIRFDPTKFAKQGICYKGFICKVY